MEIENKKGFTDYLNVLFKWKKFILINFIVILLLVIIYAFTLPDRFKSTATIMMPPESSMSGLSSLLGSGKSTSSLGAKFFGLGGQNSQDMVLGLLNSKTVLKRIIKELDLYSYYEVNDKNIDKTIKLFKSDLLFSPNEFGMIDVSVTNKNPQISNKIVNLFLKYADSLTLELNRQNATNNRAFIEKRYFENVDALKKAEDELYKFQKKNKIFAMTEQLTVSVKAAAEIESKFAEAEIMKSLYKETYGVESPEYKKILTQSDFYRKKIDELKNSSNLSSESNILVPFSNIPDIYIEYAKIYRELEVQNRIMEITLPLYEQAKAEEGKSIPSFLVVDEASVPMLKDEPKRAFIVLALSFIALIALVLISYILEFYDNEKNCTNLFDTRMSKIVNISKRLYRIKY